MEKTTLCRLIWRVFLSFAVALFWAITGIYGQVFFLRDTFCSNQIILVNGHLYGPDMPTGTEVLPGAAANGADSIIEVRLVFFQPAKTNLNQTLCNGDTLWVNHVPYHSNFRIGQEIIEGGAANGCDSIIDVNLSFKDTALLVLAGPLCEGDTIVINGVIYDAFHPKGIEKISAGAAGGCDSVIVIDFTPIPLPFTEIIDTLCPDSFLVINGRRYDVNNRSGLEILPNAAASGCDSLVNIRLVFRELWVSLGEDTLVGPGDSICLYPYLNFAATDVWWDSPTIKCLEADCIPSCQIFFAKTDLTFYARDNSGCVLSDDIRVNVDRKPRLYTPNVFKPGAAWPNNYFYLIPSAGITTIVHFQIASRWGELILTKENLTPDVPEEGWDGVWKGVQAPPGVYIYWAEVEWWNGAREKVSGSFTLLR